MAEEFVIDLPWDKPPLSLNYRMHHQEQGRIVKQVRALMHAKARSLPSMERCEVTLTWFVKDRRKRDDENPVPTLKALCDGLVDAEVVPEDTNEFMVKKMPVIEYRPGVPASMQITIKDIGEKE